MNLADHLPYLKLEPARSYLKPGESIVVDCSSSMGTAVDVIWEKHGGESLPYNFRVSTR